MKKILFVMPQLGSGGAERVVLNIINSLDRSKFDINLILINQTGKYFNQLSKDVNVTVLNKKVRYSFLSLIKEIRKSNPDLLFSSIRGTSVVLFMIKKFLPNNIKYIFREMNTPSESLKVVKYKRLMRYFYTRLEDEADVIVCQSKFMLNDFIDNFGYSNKNMVQIYNPVDTENIDKLKLKSSNPFKKDKLNIVSIGRLNEQKNHERLIKSMPLLLKKHPNAHVYLLGEGKLKKMLENLIDFYELNNSVSFIGFVENPYKWLSYCDLYVLHSHYEGLPNVLLEAIYCGAPVISTKHPGGTEEILELTNQSNRYVDSLSWENDWFIKNHNEGKDLLFENFNLDYILEQYNELFLAI